MVNTLESVIDAGPFVVFRWQNDPSWTIEYISSNLKPLFGYSPADFIRGRIHYEDLLHPDDLAAAARAIAEASRREEGHFEQEYRIRKKGDDFVWVRDFTRIVRDRSGAITHYQSYIWEITRQKEAEAALQALNESQQKQIEKTLASLRERDAVMIQQSRHAALGEMIGNIAHQWRQPLNALAIMVQDLEESHDQGELDRDRLGEIVSKSMVLINYLSTTIDDFRNFYRSDQAAERFNLSEAIEAALGLVEAAMHSHAIAIKKELPKEPLYMLGHKNQFAQALINLFTNAKDAIVARQTPSGCIDIVLNHRSDEAVLSITDNGGGIDAAVLPKIFDPYFTTKHQSQGTGVGLYMTRMIIERNMDGHIYAENSGEGARFTIVLPLKGR
jgi:PAS domain S-box-containing protein